MGRHWPKARSPDPLCQRSTFAVAAGSSVPFGTIIESCTVPGTVALTFDDGPYIYTSQNLDTLKNNYVPRHILREWR